MKKTLVFPCIMAIVFSVESYGQQLCKVLLPAIAGSYTGECKNGLASGIGEATGIDFYSGEFAKGLPDGKGTYTWKNGATYKGDWKKGLRDGTGIYTHRSESYDTVLDGTWKEDKFIGKKIAAPYVIEYRDGIGRVTCMRTGDRPYIKYIFTRNGGVSNNMTGLFLQGSSGTEIQSTAFAGFEYVSFPFHGTLRFSAPNNFYAATIRCELRLTINQPGAWIVTIFY